MSPQYLYRGVHLAFNEAQNGLLRPKGQGVERMAMFDGSWTFGDGIVFGSSKTNGVIFHQKDSSRFPTSFVSFSPHLERATYYATHRSPLEGGLRGIVYVVDTALFQTHGVESVGIADYALQPTCPEDDEVALLASDGGPLPEGIIVDRLLVG